MSRQDALVMKEIYLISKEQNRAVYADDLVSRRKIAKGSSKKTIEALAEKGYLNMEVEKGANVYNVSVKGREQMLAYRDIRIELEAAV